MSRGDLPALARLDIADDPGTWTRLGFTVGADGTTRVGDVELHFGGAGAGRGIIGWGLRGAAALPPQIDGIPTVAAQGPAGASARHANGASGIDHVVVATPDLDRTLAALRATGLAVSRVRDTGQPGPRARQAFLWSGDVILEVAGPHDPEGDGPAMLWGLVVVTPEVDALPARTDGLVGSIRDAVQPGRRIAPVRREAGSSVPLAFLSPHVRNGTSHEEQSTA